MISSTRHQIAIGSAAEQIKELADLSVDLIVTSPPYPMIEMWDEIMANQNSSIKTAQQDGDGSLTFELMHVELDKIWSESERVLKPGGYVCVNIGDATRTINERFALYNNSSRIVSAFIKLGLTNMPNVIWRKQTNAPNKFMGSGMLPAGAYVTLEHEWILIFRKGGKRPFKTELEKDLRRESAFFWEERNIWFSDLWDLKGTRQKVDNSQSRSRSAAYPFELPYRLINMYSVKGDLILDPFLGTGTTTLAAIASQRNSVGIEIDPSFAQIVDENINDEVVPAQLNRYVQSRVEQHKTFLQQRSDDAKKGEIKHFNPHLNLPVMTSQETGMKLSYVSKVDKVTGGFEAYYSDIAKSEHLNFKRRSIPNQEIINF